LSVHRLRQGLFEERTALINRLRGLLIEFGVVAQLSPEKLRQELRHCRDEEKANLPHTVRQLVRDALAALDTLEERIDAYAAQIAAQLGAHIIKVKLPTDHLEQAAAKKVYDAQQIPIKTLAERVRHVVQSAFDGRRVVIFSGGATKEDDNALFEEARAIRDGGGFGSIIGRNSFQRKKADALKLLRTISGIYAGTIP